MAQADQNLCHLRCTAGDRSTIRRAAQHLGQDMSQFARDAWAWWEEQVSQATQASGDLPQDDQPAEGCNPACLCCRGGKAVNWRVDGAWEAQACGLCGGYPQTVHASRPVG